MNRRTRSTRLLTAALLGVCSILADADWAQSAQRRRHSAQQTRTRAHERPYSWFGEALGGSEESEEEAPQPSILDPGPDTADFPDSAFTVKPGVVYFETSLTYESSKGERVRDYFTPTLIRVGIAEDIEFRLASPGIIYEDAPDDSTSGFGPLIVGFKFHMWEEREEAHIPALGIIVQVQAPTASAGFDNGTAEPTVFFNYDWSLPHDFAFEFNAGISWLHDDAGDRFVQGIFLWSLSRDWPNDFKTFFHGFLLTPAGSGVQEELMIGPGIFRALNNRVAVDFSYNFGLTPETPHRNVRLGLSMAF